MLNAKFNNFRKLAIDTLNEMGKQVSPECQLFLDKPVTELLSTLKLLIGAGSSLDEIQDLVLSKLSIRKEEIPPEKMKKIQRYGEYLYSIAKLL